MTSKQRAYLKSLAMKLDPVFNVGKSSITPEFTVAISEVLETRELIKSQKIIRRLNFLKNDGKPLFCRDIYTGLQGRLLCYLKAGWRLS